MFPKSPVWIKPHLIIGLLTGLVAYYLTPGWIGGIARLVVAWDALALTYIVISGAVLGHAANHESLKRSAAAEDQSQWVILLIVCVASFVSLSAIGTLLSDTKTVTKPIAHLHLVLGGITVLMSWLMVHMAFAIHYVHRFYGDVDERPDQYQARGGMAFPETPEPVFSDFIYYSFVIGMTCQVSDVQITGRGMRRLSTAQGILAFFFNTIILALTVNIAAGLFS